MQFIINTNMCAKFQLISFFFFKCLSASDVSNHLSSHYFVHHSPEELISCAEEPGSKYLQPGYPAPTYSSPSHDFSLEKLISLGVSHYVAEILKFASLDRIDYFFCFIHPL